jgi:hypothetical protein
MQLLLVRFGSVIRYLRVTHKKYVVNPKRGDQYSPLLVDSLPLRQKKAEANLDIRQQRIPETVSQDAAG